MLTAAMTAAAQLPAGAATKVKAAQPAPVATVQSQVASGVVAPPTAVAVQLGQQRRQSFERTRVLAGTSGTITLPPDLRAQCASVMSQHQSDHAQFATPGFGTQAGQSGPYVEEHFADGVVVYRFSGGTVVAPPNASAYYCAYMVMRIDVPRAAPPAIPADNSQQAKWARYHNSQLHDVIARLVNHDAATLQKIDLAADAETHGDLFQMTDFLTGVANFYAGNAP
jgi:hypothetical protein